MRVALLVDSENVDYHTYRLYQSLLNSEKLDVVSIVRQHQAEELIYEPNGLHDRNIRLTHHLSVMDGLAVMDGFGRWGYIPNSKK